MSYFYDDDDKYAHWAVPKDDDSVIDETEEAAQRMEDADDDDFAGFNAGYEPKGSIEKTEIKHVRASKTFTCKWQCEFLLRTTSLTFCRTPIRHCNQ